MLLWHDAAGVDVAAQHRPLVLLAVGPEGGAALARWVEAHGLEGVAGVGLVGVTAPWAGRVEPCGYCSACRAPQPAGSYVPLDPLEPLRKVAERARVGEPCPCEHHPDPNRVCASCINRYTNSLRFVVACAPDDGVCAECGGSGEIVISDSVDGFWNCVACSGTGKALSSADVARELSGDTCVRLDVWQVTHGGVTISHYPTRADLDKHGLAATLKAVA